MILIRFVALFLVLALPFHATANDDSVRVMGVKKFTIIGIPDPISFYMQNRTLAGAIIPLLPIVRDQTMKAFLTEKISEKSPGFGRIMEKELSRKLNEKGLVQVESPNVRLNKSRPGSIDYKSVEAVADIILHIYFEEVGLRSFASSTYYVPYAYVRAFGVMKFAPDDWCLLDYSSSYGDGRGNGKFSYASLPEHKWSSKEDVEANVDQVISAYKDAIDRISTDIASAVPEAICEY